MSRNVFAIFSTAALLAGPYLLPALFPLAWVAFVPLFFVLERANSLRGAIFYGWLMGLAAHLIGFHWLTYTISAFGGFPYAASIIIFILYAALQALQMALFALLVRAVGFGPLGIFPALFSPSVNRTIARLFDFLSFNLLAAAAIAEPIAVPSSTKPMRTLSRFCRSQSWSSVRGLTT